MAKKPARRFTTTRDWGIATDQCTLCGAETRVFWFDDNERYSTEGICLECLRDAVELLRADQAGGE